MKHTRSSAEVEIRDAVVARLRELLPSARIVHEFNVDEGMNRVDVAAIGRDRMVFVEIKSERDKPHRLARQLHAFGPRCHALILTAHEKWFESPGTEKRARRTHKLHVPQRDPDTGTMTLAPGTIEDWYNVHLPSPLDGVPPRGVSGGKGRRAVRHCRADQRATAGRLMRGSSLNWPTLSSVM